MFKIEIVKFEAQDVITASGVATHQHHFNAGDGGSFTGGENNTAILPCEEPGCNSTTTVDQPVEIFKTYTW